MSEYKILKFNIAKNKGSSLTDQGDLEQPETRGIAAHELALKVLARVVGVEYYFSMNAEVRSALVHDVEKALNDFRPDLKEARTKQLENGKQPVATETVQFITETRDAILAAPAVYNGHSLKLTQNAVNIIREVDLAKRALLEKKQEHLADEQVIEKFAEISDLPESALKKAFPDAYQLLVTHAANDLRVGKADDETLKVLGFEPEARLKIADAVSQELESIKAHAVTHEAKKTFAAVGVKGLL